MKRFLLGICLLFIWYCGFSITLDSCMYYLHVYVNCHQVNRADLIVLTTDDNGHVDSLVFHKTSNIKIPLFSEREYAIKFIKSGYYSNQILLDKNLNCKSLTRLVELKQMQIRIDYLPVIQFNFNEYENNSDSAKEAIRNLYNILHNNPSIKLSICGFKESGWFIEKASISNQRANFIRDQLVILGVSSESLIIESCSNRPYVCRNTNRMFPQETILDKRFLKTLNGAKLEVARTLNRRVELKIVTN